MRPLEEWKSPFLRRSALVLTVVPFFVLLLLVIVAAAVVAVLDGVCVGAQAAWKGLAGVARECRGAARMTVKAMPRVWAGRSWG